jgi:regulator of sigma E protease
MELQRTILCLSHNILFALAGIIGISLVVAIHEFGHFLFCKLFNIRTPSFSIGFGPRLFSKKIGGTEFAISAIPLGGYVEIAGAAEMAQGEQKEAHSRDEHSFSQKPWYQKFLVMIGGILFNIIFAYLAISLLFMVGMPKTKFLYPGNATPTVEMVKQDTPAYVAGLQPQDLILAINGRAITEENSQTLIQEIQNNPSSAVTLHVKRNVQELDISFTPASREFLGKTVGLPGFMLSMHSLPGYSLTEAVSKGFQFANRIMRDTVLGFKYIFSSGDTTMVEGPIKIIAATMQGAKEGFKTYILFLVFISISLAILNLLPLPILDGGQIVYYTIEALMGRPIPDRIREYIHIACWLAFLVLVLVLSYRDIRDLISPYFDTIAGWFKSGPNLPK